MQCSDLATGNWTPVPGYENVLASGQTEAPIVDDDLGWSDTTLYGHSSLYETPNLERLAKRGMTFTRAYSASPLCSPTRSSILTGRNPARTGLTTPCCHLPQVTMEAAVMAKAPPGDKARGTVSVSRLDTSLPTLGKRLLAGGYTTAHFGKWHLGSKPYSPLEHGFEVDIPHWPGPGPGGSFVAPWSFRNFKENYPKEHIEDRMAEEAVTWLKSVAGKEKPFYMNYWQFSVHAPFDAKQSLIDRYRPKIDRKDAQCSPTYVAMVHSLDDAIGSLLDAVDGAGLTDRTAIIFISDNGGNMYNGIPEKDVTGKAYVTAPTSNRPLRGGKATMYEGGIRVPCVVVWPGVVKPGSRSDEMIQSTDFYPTILKMLGQPLPQDYVIDGIDIASALRGGKMDRDAMFTFFPHAPGVPDWLPPSMSVHSGDWKLIRLFHQGENGAHDYRLYNLADDIGERNDLAARHPEKVAALDAAMEAYIKDAGVVVPLPNPAFDPAKYRPQDIGVQKGGLRVAGRPRGGKAAKPAKGAPAAAGWRSKGKTVGLRVTDGELIIHSTAGDPWVQTTIDPPLEGPFMFEFETMAASGGPGVVFGGWDGKGFQPGTYIQALEGQPGTWVSSRVKLPAKGKLTSLRIDPPGTAGTSRLRNIRLLDAEGKLLKQWP